MMTADRQRLWLRLGLLFLTIVQLPIGIWAVLAPENFYKNFPGFDHHWVSTQGPFNHHLVTDAGSGFLAVGAVLLLAALWLERSAVIVALVASLVHDVPHFVFHAFHRNHELSNADSFLGTYGIAFDIVLAAVLLAWVLRSRSRS
jgi:predicted anti-sigma-YlaC factor YlaD